MMDRLRSLAVTLALVAAAGPAAAQFNPFEAIFGPFRPPADVPGRSPPADRLPPGPPPSRQYPDQYPPSTRLPPGPPPSQQYPRQYPEQYPPAARLPPGAPPGVQREALPPPPGSSTAPSQQGRPSQPRPAPGTPGAPQNGEIITPSAQKIVNPTAVFSGLDKITGRIISFDVAVNETVQFGALQVTPRACYTRPPSEAPNTDAFLEVDEVTLQGEVRRIFTGWMFAASPGLHAVEHSIYDVWLVDCKGGSTVVAETPPDAAQPAPAPQRPPPQQRPQRPRQPPPPPAEPGAIIR
jgi:hypothetical protein